MALPVKALKAGQEAYWLDQIARNREEYFSGRGESPGPLLVWANVPGSGRVVPQRLQPVFAASQYVKTPGRPAAAR